MARRRREEYRTLLGHVVVLKRETRIAEAERDSAVDSLERITQKYNDLKRMRNIKRVTFVGGA